MPSKSFNQSSARSSGSALRVESNPIDHTIAHEVLLVAIMKKISEMSGSNIVLAEIRQTCDDILKAENRPTAARIAGDLITEASQRD
jgi:hypothetical protein